MIGFAKEDASAGSAMLELVPPNPVRGLHCVDSAMKLHNIGNKKTGISQGKLDIFW
jgi:hypothetical protein